MAKSREVVWGEETLALKTLFVCRGPRIRRSHGAGTRDQPQERLRGRRERVAAARHPPQATARLASLSDIFPF